MMGHLRSVQRLAEKVSLSFSTLVSLEEGELLLCFDALGDDAQLKVSAHIDYGPHDGRVIWIEGDLTHEGLVDFQDINGKPAKIAQAGITGAKVIHGQVYA